MKNRFFTWYFLFVKRLFKIPSFIVILLLLPCIMFAGRFLSSKDSGILRVGIYVNDSDRLSRNIIEELSDEESLFHFQKVKSEEDGKALLAQNKVDAVWIFPDSLEKELEKLAIKQTIKPVIKVYEREESTALIFLREVFCAKIFPDFSYKAYSHYVTDIIGLDDISPQSLEKNYQKYSEKIELFNVESDSSSSFDYLRSPLRGLVALWLVLCGLAASLYYLNDREKNTFIKLPAKYYDQLSIFSHFVVVSIASFAAFAAVLISGNYNSISYEIIGIILLSFDAVLFCFIISSLCPKKEILAFLLPVILLLMLVICPVFIDLRFFNFLKFIFPIFYYIQASGDTYYYVIQLVYTGVLIAFAGGVIFIKKISSQHSV